MDRDSIKKIFEEFRANQNTIEISIEQTKKDLGLLADKIVLYGAGSAGIAFLKYLQDIDLYPHYFADGNPEKWGQQCEGIPIISPKDIVKKVGEEALVIVTINTDGKRYCKSFSEALRNGGHTKVHQNLQECGCKNIIDYTYFRRCHLMFHGDKYNLPSCSDVYLMEKNEDKIQKVYEMMADDLSKDIYLKILRFRMLDDSITVPTIKQEKQYFEYTFYDKKDDEVFIDCGAYNGITLKTFLQENKNFDKYYGFEPDRNNFDLLKEYVSQLPENVKNKIKIMNKGVYNSDDKVRLYSLKGPGSFVSDIGKDVISTIKIDTALNGERASYIKMNIEGSEIEALKGAKQTLSAFHPKLAIAGYHKTWDLWEIPLLINQYYDGYKFYLRSYMNHISFVYYAI